MLTKKPHGIAVSCYLMRSSAIVCGELRVLPSDARRLSKSSEPPSDAVDKKDRSLAVLVGAVCYHKVWVGEGLVKYVPVETSLGAFLQLFLQLSGLHSMPLGPSVQFLAVLLLADAAKEPVAHSARAPADGEADTFCLDRHCGLHEGTEPAQVVVPEAAEKWVIIESAGVDELLAGFGQVGP
jgi:hypothetical protein